MSTIQDVVRLSGVSVATVPRVLNDSPNVLPATREKVLAAIPAEQAEVIKESFYNGRTLSEIADSKSQTVENVRRKQVDGLRAIRRGKYIHELERFVDLETNFYRPSSVNRFNASHASVVEELVLFRERKRGEYYRSIC